MKILAIETSCDDTCIAILEIKGNKNPRFKTLSNIVSSQVKLHAKYGGVWPSLAKREHERNLPIVLNRALRKAGFANPKSEIRNPKQIQNTKYKILNTINLIAVTVGPGLEPCLWMGVNFAKELAKKLNVPIVPVNHVEAHIFANWLTPIGKIRNLFPAICLIVSGGHTQLILMHAIGKYKILGETRDDAAGECFDKTARILWLGYPGGPIISKIAKSPIYRDSISIELPRPMIYQKNYDFSFSGLKTAVLYLVKQLTEGGKKLTACQKREISAEIQQAVIDVLIRKTMRAAKDCKAKTIILGGGVAANDELRKQFQKVCSRWNLEHLVPPKNLCTDNAAMTAAAAYFRFKTLKSRRKNDWKDIKADANLRLE
jgi:N6-L-threonylcarbamoyladenine synthase